MLKGVFEQNEKTKVSVPDMQVSEKRCSMTNLPSPFHYLHLSFIRKAPLSDPDSRILLSKIVSAAISVTLIQQNAVHNSGYSRLRVAVDRFNVEKDFAIYGLDLSDS